MVRMCSDIYRIKKHPILPIKDSKKISFYFEGKKLSAKKGETISSALFANGIRIFGHHKKDGAPQGIFCSNGQCSQCLVIADGISVKSCITPVNEGMVVERIEKKDPKLKEDDKEIGNLSLKQTEVKTEVFIIGAGPAGLSVAIELGRKGVPVIIADDKSKIGGKLSLQTHKFFGSIKECYAGTRGIDIGELLLEKIQKLDSVEVWLNSPVVGCFSDRKIGVLKNGKYILVKPKRLVVTTGAREKALAFKGCDLPGVYGAGAFQTLVNRDLIKAAKRLFIVGGGNVGLIAAFHALQAGIDVLGIVEALPKCGGYKVHEDKLKRLGVPIFTSHTVLEAIGNENLERVIIAQINDKFNPIPQTEKEFEVDTLLIAVGLDSVNELLQQAKEFGINTYAAGDAEVIAEASAAIFSGKITGRKILRDVGHEVEIPKEWLKQLKVMRGKPGKIHDFKLPKMGGNLVYPIIRCIQEIPCDPCVDVCPNKSISIKTGDIMGYPSFEGKCAGCGRCVVICPGMAITLVDEGYDKTKNRALVTIPWEMPEGTIKVGQEVITTGFEGEIIGKGKVVEIRKNEKWQDKRQLVKLDVPFDEAPLVAGIRIRDLEGLKRPLTKKAIDDSEVIICRCERVSKKMVMDCIKEGERDFNALKAKLRVGMGPCGGKTCTNLIMRIFKECGVNPRDIKQPTKRPFEMEIPLKAFLDYRREGKE
jgi:NADPH-dependent 2,4-dienoyl-CoA reductase/sulfur reductase-like enzyme